LGFPREHSQIWLSQLLCNLPSVPMLNKKFSVAGFVFVSPGESSYLVPLLEVSLSQRKIHKGRRLMLKRREADARLRRIQ
jgi:hypothetical protein